MRLSDIIVYGLVIAVIIILLRIIFFSPMVRQIAEAFAVDTGGAALSNTTTTCPPGSKFYMYGGKAYCCSGRINTDADNLHGSCRSMELSGEMTFCALGPTEGKVKNCQEALREIYAQRGKALCPPSKPNYARSNNGAEICCAGAVNAEMTGCLNKETGVCNITGSKNPYAAGVSSCEFEKISALDKASCPSDYGTFTIGGFGPLTGLTLNGCTNNKNYCFSKDTIARMQEFDINTHNMVSCGDSHK